MPKKPKSLPCAVPVGTRVVLTMDNMGASAPVRTPVRDADDVWLARVTSETYGVGDEGVVVWPHPNRKALPDWFYVEVDSKAVPGEKRYVGCSPHTVKIVD